MRFIRLSVILGLLGGSSLVVRADTQPWTDPEIAIDADSFSTPVTLGPTCNPPIPTADGGGICGLVNDTGSTINLLEFEDSVGGPELTGLPPGSGVGQYPSPSTNPVFTCDPTAYFAECIIIYQTPPVTTTDEVTIEFFGGSGIANGQHFEVDLNTNNALSGDSGGWTQVDAGPLQTAYIGSADAAPEPSMTWLLAAGCLLIFALSARASTRKRLPHLLNLQR